MTLLVMPTFSCNLSCAYCFESLLGVNKKPKVKYNLVKMIRSISRLQSIYRHNEIVLHGGEPLLMPLKDMVKLFDFAKALGVGISIQSNCTMITDDHIDVFKKYNVRVGCSVDGPPELNVLRGYWNRDKPDTKLNEQYNKLVHENIVKLAENKLLGGIIVVVHRCNAGDVDKLRKLVKWIDYLSDLGVKSGRLNPMFSVAPWSKQFELSCEELYRAYTWMWKNFFEDRDDLSWSPFVDIVSSLMGQEHRTICWFAGCNFYDSFVWTVGPDGEILSCDRTLSYGLWSRARPLPYTSMYRYKVRAIALLQTELKDSKYGHLHKGGCPCEAVKGDWRRPSRFVPLWEKLFEYFEKKIKAMMPWIKLASEVPDKIEYIEMISRGCRWNPMLGRYECPDRSR